MNNNLPVNPRLLPDQVTARNSRGDCMICLAKEIPDGWEAIQRGPERAYLLSLLAGHDQAAAYFLRGMREEYTR